MQSCQRSHSRAADVAKFLLAGADVVMTTSAPLRHGPAYATEMLDGLSEWMLRQGFNAVDEVRGMLSVPRDAEGAKYERALYVSAPRAAKRQRLRPLVTVPVGTRFTAAQLHHRIDR